MSHCSHYVDTGPVVIRWCVAGAVGFISITRYPLWIRRLGNIAVPRDHKISYTNARLMQTMQNGDNYLREGHLKVPDIRPVGDRAPPHLPTHVSNLFECLLSKLPLQAHDDGSGGGRVGRASWVASTAMLCPRLCWSTEVCVS